MSKIFDSLRWAEAERRKMLLRKRKEAAPDVLNPGDVRKAVVGSGPAAAPIRGERGKMVSGDLLRQIGILRNSLDSLFIDKPKRSILFTSAIPGEGTTTVSTNFARFLAMQTKGNTLLCEMNARNPSFSKMFSMNGQVGLTDYFERKSSLESIVQSLDKGLDIVQIGKHDPDLIQVYLNRVFPELVQAAMGIYDTVIFDAPSVINYPETPPMASFVDGVVMVVQAGKTKREIVQRSIATISRANGKLLGVVLNRKKYYIPEFLYKRI